MNLESLMWQIQQKADVYAAAMRVAGWRLRRGVNVVINPDFRCPYCGKGFPTGRVWMIDEDRHKLLGCWYVDDPITEDENGPLAVPRLRKVGNSGREVVHPHADSSGGLCMGTAKTVSQLLFHSVAPGKHHRHTDMWLLSVGHECPDMPTVDCKVCGVTMYYILASYYNFMPVCGNDCRVEAGNRYCYECYTPLEPDRPVGHYNYCPNCAEKHMSICASCREPHLGAYLRPIRLSHKVCPNCYETASSPCIICKVPVPYKEMIPYGKCRDCESIACSNCGGIYRRSQMTVMTEEHDKLRCPACVPRPPVSERCRQCGRYKRIDSPEPDRCLPCILGDVDRRLDEISLAIDQTFGQSTISVEPIEISPPVEDQGVTISRSMFRSPAISDFLATDWIINEVPLDEPILVVRGDEACIIQESSSQESAESATGSPSPLPEPSEDQSQ